ncbi:MAG TPA: M14 metallopeptidase family protein [Gemmatimonadales bacterium]
MLSFTAARFRRRRGVARGALGVALALGCLPAGLAAQQNAVPHPRDILGFTPGDDYHLADFSQLREYFQRLDAASDRMRLEVSGKSTQGRDMLVAAISAAENLAQLDRWKNIARRLARGRDLPDAEARQLAREGKVIVWIDAGLHAAETAHAQHTFLLAHRMITDESEEMRRIRDNVILVLAPCVNPDGLDRAADWYRRTVHTPHQDSPMPWWFDTYTSYDNNRDFFMQTQIETQVVSRLLYFEWLPQVVYNHHQGFYPSRIFVPPFPDPFNPNIDAGVVRGIELVGAAMQDRFEREGKDGVLSRYGFSSWYNGSLRTTTYFHNMIGILTETTHDTPTPFFYDPATMPERFGNGWSTRIASTNYPRPWKGGWLRFRDVLDYMLTGSLAVLDVAARYREELLYRNYQIAARQIALGQSEAPVAYVVPPEQHDPPVAAKFLETLMRGGVELQRADSAFVGGSRSFPAGSHVISLAQAYRPFVKDLLEAQVYPDIRAYPGGPPVPPYDNAGWTLSYQMGVETVAIDRPFSAPLAAVDSFPRAFGSVAGTATWGYAIDPRMNNTVVAIGALIEAGYAPRRLAQPIQVRGETWPPGAIVVQRRPGVQNRVRRLAEELGLTIRGLAAAPPAELGALRRSRLGVYRTYVTEWVDDWVAGEGWTRWMFDQYGIRYDSVMNRDVRAGNLGARFDVMVIPDQGVGDILGGYREGRRQFELPHQALPPAQYVGGIGTEGVQQLRAFVEGGGTLVLVDRACDLATDHLGLPVRNVLAGLSPQQFFGPGSIVRVVADPTHPLAYGMPVHTAAFFRKSRAFETTAPGARSAVRYAADSVLMSGWLVGADLMAGKDAVLDLPMGRGRVILLGFSPYFRGQPHATFKLLFNALY